MTSAPTLIWAYTYRISPAQPAMRLRRLRTLLRAEHARAAAGAEPWASRLVLEDHVPHILVLASSPDLTRAVNQRIEAELTRMGAGYTVTVPLAIPTD